MNCYSSIFPSRSGGEELPDSTFRKALSPLSKFPPVQFKDTDSSNTPEVILKGVKWNVLINIIRLQPVGPLSVWLVWPRLFNKAANYQGAA